MKTAFLLLLISISLSKSTSAQIHAAIRNQDSLQVRSYFNAHPIITAQNVNLSRFNPIKPKQNPYDPVKIFVPHANSLFSPAKGLSENIRRCTFGMRVQIGFQGSKARLKGCWLGLWTSNEKRMFPFRKWKV